MSCGGLLSRRGKDGSLSFTGRPLPIPMAYPGFRQNTITSFLSRPFSSRQQGTKVCRYNPHSAGSLGWPFPVLKYEYIFQIKYTEAILSNSTGKLLWFEITKMLIAVQEKINKFTVNYYNFRHTFVPYVGFPSLLSPIFTSCFLPYHYKPS